jgi:hypothetical protein
MPVRVNLDITLAVSSTSATERDLGNIRTSILTDAWGEGGSRKLTIAGSTTDLQVSLCDLADAQFLFLKTRPKGENDPAQTITIKLNSAAGEARTIEPFGDKKEGYYLITTSGLTDIYVTNSGSIDVELTLVAAGD